MNYLPRNRTKHNFLKRVLLFSAIFILSGVLFSFADGVLISAISPLWRAENRFSVALAQSLEFFNSRGTLLAENAALKEKLNSLELKLISLSNTEQENAFLELLGRTNTESMIAAAVLTHPPQTPYDTVIIDAGSRDGVTVGAHIFLSEGPELGTVTEVFGRQSRVKLFSSGGEETNAVLERHQVPVVLEGVGAGNFKIIVPRETEVQVGDRVLSAALDTTLLAIVEEVNVSPTDAFKEVLARSPINIFAVRTILIQP